MNKVTIKAPTLAAWLTLAMVVGMIVLAVVAPLWLYWVFVLVVFVAILAVLVRWRRQTDPENKAAQRVGGPRPWVTVEWPRSGVRGFKALIAVFIALIVLLFIWLVLATIAMRVH